MARQRQSAAAVELSAEQEELAQRICQRLQTKMNEELLAMVRLMASKADHEIFGKGEFELRASSTRCERRSSPRPPTSGQKKGVPVLALLAHAAAVRGSSFGARRR